MHDRDPQQGASSNPSSADELRKIYVEITSDCNLDWSSGRE